MWTTLIAVTGTLLAGVTTHLMQARSAARRDWDTTALQTVAALAGTLVKLRDLQYERAAIRLNAPGDAYQNIPAYQDLRSKVRQLRNTATELHFTVQALITDRVLLALAHDLVHVSYTLHKAADQTELDDRHDRVSDLHNRLAAALGKVVRRRRG